MTAYFDLVKNPIGKNPNEQFYRDLYNGLHMLHGGDDKCVKRKRACLEKLLKNGIADGSLSTWEQGFVAHALGDSYAHTFTNAAGDEEAYGFPDGHGKHGTAPDQISLNPGKYADYVRSLFRALGGNPNNPAQMAMLNAIIAKGGALPGSLRAENKAMRDFAKAPPFNFSGNWIPGKGLRGPPWQQPSQAQVQSLLDKINAKCACP
jgi:hypothetical protein